jgi:hypothetical protein
MGHFNNRTNNRIVHNIFNHIIITSGKIPPGSSGGTGTTCGGRKQNRNN